MHERTDTAGLLMTIIAHGTLWVMPHGDRGSLFAAADRSSYYTLMTNSYWNWSGSMQPIAADRSFICITIHGRRPL